MLLGITSIIITVGIVILAWFTGLQFGDENQPLGYYLALTLAVLLLVDVSCIVVLTLR